jgi:hypothetical protein
MSAEIVPFNRPQITRDVERYVWTCSCGCTTFELFADGSELCASCGERSERCVDCGGHWREKLPDVPESPPELDETNFKVTNLNEPEGLMRRSIKALDHETVEALVIVHKDGTVKTSGPNFDTEECVAWIDRRLMQAREMLLRPYKKEIK